MLDIRIPQTASYRQKYSQPIPAKFSVCYATINDRTLYGQWPIMTDPLRFLTFY